LTAGPIQETRGRREQADVTYRRVVVTALDDRRPLTVVAASGPSVVAGGQVVVAIDISGTPLAGLGWVC